MRNPSSTFFHILPPRPLGITRISERGEFQHVFAQFPPKFCVSIFFTRLLHRLLCCITHDMSHDSLIGIGHVSFLGGGFWTTRTSSCCPKSAKKRDVTNSNEAVMIHEARGPGRCSNLVKKLLTQNLKGKLRENMNKFKNPPGRPTLWDKLGQVELGQAPSDLHRGYRACPGTR